MKLIAFRIRNFRSIVDSGLVPFSADGITVFVGQNESGKSSILDALFYALSFEAPTEDDVRIGSEKPSVELRIQADGLDLERELKPISKLDKKSISVLEKKLKQDILELKVTWIEDQTISKKPTHFISLNSPSFAALLATTLAEFDVKKLVLETEDEDDASTSSLTIEDVASILWAELPLGVRFSEADGSLPNKVDIDKNGKPYGTGAAAAENFLRIADVDLPFLLKGDLRTQQNTMNRANTKISREFRSFWTQTIGKSGYLTLKCEISNYPSDAEKAGAAHLVFWICDGDTQLYPGQRSKGTRWFISFYLQLKASEKAKLQRIFFLDEPGSNLHAKAQGDVLQLINNLNRQTFNVVYSTHSAQMLEYAKLFRVHAVQRSSEHDDSPTTVIDAHHLGAASSDTLSPVLTAMGIDFSHNRVIKKENNVLLEEMSGYYYLSTFWKLTQQKKTAHFIAATGVNKIEALANMFLGWGLEFIVAVDDDKAGREAYKSLKKELFGDNDDIAATKLLKLPNCPSIEDAFSNEDFNKYVARYEGELHTGTNGDYMKQNNRSKPVVAFQFMLRVENDGIKLADFDDFTRKSITSIVDKIAERLAS